ncbi:pyridoxamine 5'-phosphate oxidase family protein [Nocardioides zeae]|uniref:pyridoxamine 5'-phosphate oxidase family protein n=1 Tax=Nocardioides zeae TaxID=1457234 RepID=UPI0019D66217
MTPHSARCVWVTTLRSDGSPHTTPVWFVLLGSTTVPTLWFATARRNAKLRNLVQDARVSLAFEGTADSPWVAEGSAVVHQPINLSAHADVLAALRAKYDGWDAADPEREGPRALVEIPVVRWLVRPSSA